MKSSIFALILILFIILIVALFIVSNLLFEYIKVNQELKNENWSLTQDNTQLEQLLNACTKELKEYKNVK